VTDRKKWKDLVRQAKAHSGLQCQWKKKMIPIVLRDIPFSQNQPLKTVDDYHIVIVKNKTKT
jgi:hypothetical protein